MPEVLTIDQINQRFPNEWILIGDPETDDSLEVLRGTILFHSSDRDEMYRKSVELKPKRSATLYTGSLPDDMEFAL